MKRQEAFEQIKRGFEAGRLAQGYVIAGADLGVCIRLADDLLQLFLCKSMDKPCCTCRACRQALDRTHTDLLWIAPQKKSRIIPVKTIREMEGRIYMTSYEGGWKVCVIECADRMKEQAANAFLKTLEEPPSRTIFFLLTDSPQFLLPTVVSRCQRINIASEADEVVAEWQEPVLEILADVGKHKPIGDFALTDRLMAVLKILKDGAEVEERERCKRDSVEEDDEVLEARVSARYRGLRTKVIRFMMTWFRDLFVLAGGAGEDSVIQTEMLDVLLLKAKKLDYCAAKNNLAVVEEMNRQLEGNVTERGVLTLGFGKLQ
jgi:DNA polymerase-3 subunit delta'